MLIMNSRGRRAGSRGIPMWADDSGNHTWVEIWDKDWHFAGADEYDAKGLNHGWFTGNAAKADAADPLHSIYATSWKHDGGFFPMAWSPENKSVGGINVTGHYAVKTASVICTIAICFFNGPIRVERQGTLIGENGKAIATFRTKAGTADLNDMPRIVVKPGETYRLSFVIGGETLQTATFSPELAGGNILDIRESDLQHVPIPQKRCSYTHPATGSIVSPSSRR